METFSALLALCAGNSPVPGEFPAQRPVTRSFAVFFDLRPNKRLNAQWWGWWFETSSSPLWRHCNARIPSQRTALKIKIASFPWIRYACFAKDNLASCIMYHLISPASIQSFIGEVCYKCRQNHIMETVLVYLTPLYRNSSQTCGLHSRRPVMRIFGVFSMLIRTRCWTNSRFAGAHVTSL